MQRCNTCMWLPLPIISMVENTQCNQCITKITKCRR